MKTIKFIALAICLGVLAISCNSSEENVKVDSPLPTASEIDSVSYLIGFNFGYFIKGNGFGTDLNFAEIRKGMQDVLNSELDQYDEGFEESFKINPQEMNRLFSNHIEKIRAYEAEKNLKIGEKFLANNKKKAGVITLENGLQYQIIEDGNDNYAVSDADTVWVKYTGTLTNGKKFDSSKRTIAGIERNDSVMFLLNRVIPGFTQGLKLVGEGGRIKLFIPANLGYGERETGKIKSNSALIFDVEVCKVGKKEVPAVEE